MAVREIIHRLKLAGEDFARSYRAEMDKVRTESERAGEDSAEGFARGFTLKHAAITAAAGAAGAAIGNAIRESLDLAADLSTTSKEIGIGVERLQEWRYAASEMGVAAGDLDGNIGKLTEKIGQAHDGNRAAQRSFVDLGVGFDTISGQARGTEAVFVDVIDKLSQIESPAERARVGTELFGEQFARLEPILYAGAAGFEAAAADAEKFGAVLSSEEIRSLEKANADLERMKNILSVRIAQVVADNTSAILAMADGLGYLAQKASDAVTWYQRFKLSQGSIEADLNADFYSISPFAADRRKAPGYRAEAERYRAARDAFDAANPRGPRGSIGGGLLSPATLAALREPTAAPRVTSPASSRASGSTGRRTASTGPSAAEREADRAAKEAQRNEEAFAESIRKTLQLQTDSAEVERIRAELGEESAAAEEARLSFLRQHPLAIHQTVEALATALGITRELTEADRQRLQTYIDGADEAERGAVLGARTKVIEKNVEEAERAAQRQAEAMRRAHEDAVQDVAGLWEDLFTGGTKRIWSNFKREGIRIISEIAAEYTLALISGQSAPDLGSVAGSVFSRSPLSSIFTGGRTSYGGAANDNGGGIVVTRGAGFGFPDGILPGDQPGIPDVQVPGAGAPSLLEKAGIAIAATVAAQLVGGRGTGSQLGSLAGSIGGQALGSSIAALGSFGGPIGAIAGAILGALIGGAFSSTKRGSATIGVGSGGLGVLSTRGNSSSRISGSVDAASGVFDTIGQIVDALGGDLNSNVSPISLGIREGNWRLDPTGQGITKTANGAIDYGGDAEGAARAAIKLLLERGIVGGISDAAQSILTSGQDLEAAIEKAVLIESVPDLLAQRIDPLGYALDEVFNKFKDLADALREGGASAEQIAQARQLYDLEVADVMANTGGGSATLTGFLSSLSTGSNSPLSPRQQFAAAQAAFAPFAGQVDAARAARDKVEQLKAAGAPASEIAAAEAAARAAAAGIDQQGFTSSAQSLLGLSRSINASSGGFFSDFDRIRSLTGTAIGLVDAVSTAPTQTRDPFTEATANNTADIAAILDDLPARIAEALNDNGLVPIPASWLDQSRGFASAS